MLQRPLPQLAAAHLAALLLLVAAHPARADDPTIDFTVVASDTLAGLSQSVLVSPTAWREVARLNRLPNANRIVPGQVLKIPTRLLRVDARDARIVSTNGDVRVGDTPAVEGAIVREGQSVQTGTASSAVIAMGDGSRMRLPPSSLAQVTASRQLGERTDATAAATAAEAAAANAPSGWFAGTMRVLRGSVEVLATKVLRAKPLEVVTPTAVVGVRGTRYRVSVDGEANDRTRGEVVEGLVRFDVPSAATGTDVGAGFGVLSDTAKSGSSGAGVAPSLVKLPGAPDLSGIAPRFEKPLIRFALPAETSPLRIQIASDNSFDKIVLDRRVEAGAEVRIPDLEDAQWYLRARRIDAMGIEGLDAERGFVLKARPQPPVYRTPRADAGRQIGKVEFAWASNAEAPQVHVQIAEDEAFTQIVQDRNAVAGGSLNLEMKKIGTYYWRVASVRANGDQGPFGDPQRFEMRALPEPPSVGRSADGKSLTFKWSGRPQDRQQVELARDAEFTQIVAKDELALADWSLPTPSGGRYYFRYRSVEPDGYVTPFSDKLVVDVPSDSNQFWLILLPLLILL